MSNNVKALIKKMQDDEDFRRKVENAGTPAEKHAILDEAGFGGITKDAVEQFTGVSSSSAGELSDDELEAVAGGRPVEWAAVIVAAIAAAA